MARQAKTAEAIDYDGLVATYHAAHADGFSVRWQKGLVAHVKQGTGARVVTVPTPGTVEGRAIADEAVTVAENTERFIRLDSQHYRQSDDTVYLNFDATTNTTVALLILD